MMRRLWIAAGLLLALLGASLGNAQYAKRLTDGMREQLYQARVQAELGEWGRAEALTRQVYEDWQSRHFYLHTTMRHSDTDQVLRGFRTVLEYVRLQEPDQYNAANADLIAQLEMLAEMEQPTLTNVL